MHRNCKILLICYFQDTSFCFPDVAILDLISAHHDCYIGYIAYIDTVLADISNSLSGWHLDFLSLCHWPMLTYLQWGCQINGALTFLACSRACASKVFSLRADCGRVIVYPGLKQWERPRHNIFGVCTRLAGGVCMSTSANSSASKHLTVTKIVWKIVYVTFDYLISHFFKILSLEFMANLFRDFRASVSLKVFHYRLRGKWCQYDLEIN